MGHEAFMEAPWGVAGLAGMALHTVPSWGQGCQTFTAYTFPSPDGGLRGSSETLVEALPGAEGIPVLYGTGS